MSVKELREISKSQGGKKGKENLWGVSKQETHKKGGIPSKSGTKLLLMLRHHALAWDMIGWGVAKPNLPRWGVGASKVV